mgnify:CR=1 FL=1
MSQPTSTLTRAFLAPPKLVFQAWTDPALLAQWFLPTGFTNARCDVDLRPGGEFRVHMRAPDGQIYPTHGRYLAVTAPDSLQYVDTWDDDREHNPPVRVTVAFEADNGDTRQVITSQFISEAHRDEVMAQGVADGWEMFFRNLDALLAKLVAT